ncbi:ABC transporter ATP-binding protein [Paenirhodobacter sp.]|uniref:ABC transporter ATP-binding protein n=1 Tax=Paenirhodobacter sp. TaxID=1965326 RepID=UPI003B50F2B6
MSSLAVMGLLPPAARASGRIVLNGRDILGLPEAQMNRIRGAEAAMIFQEPMTSLNPVMPIGPQIAEPLCAHRGLSPAQARSEALRLMERVRIPATARRYNDFPHQFSGGMRQRVMIAIALACKPQLLIADEPTTALDVTIQAQVLELIKELQDEEHMAVLFITHDMGVVAEVADRCLVMCRGDQIETGPTARIFAAPQAPYTRALLSAVPRLGAMAGIAHPQPFPIYDTTTGTAPDTPQRPDTVRPGRPYLLEVAHLTARFDIRSPLLRRVTARVHAVEDVSFTLQRGETLAIVGESGCGKSTTGRLVTGLHRPTSGSIVVEGREVAGYGPRALARHVQMVFQDPFASLNPRLTVGEAIAEPLAIHALARGAEARDIAADLLRKVGLPPDSARRYPHEFSGGQRQRICIARALALKPRIIVADEAVSALDVSVKAQVVNLLMDLQREMDLGFVFISHDMAVVERISHRVAVMYMGEIVEIGPRAEVFGNPRHPYTRRLLAAVPVPDPARRSLRQPAPGGEIRSPLKPRDFVPPARHYETAGPGHIVQIPGPDWA